VADEAVTVPAGASEVTFDIPIVDDAEAEPTETLFVSVTAPAGFTVGRPDAMVAILDDENPLPAPTTRAVAVGDIACAPTDPSYLGGNGTGNLCRQKATSDVALALDPQAVLGLGDLQYENGELDNFHNSYDPTWGRLKSVTYPAPGNHEYYSSGAPGYYGYFVASGDGAEGGTVDPWYAADVGSWRVIALNSNCGSVGGCGVGSPQESWLRQELADHPARCTVAFWHAPRFSSGVHGDDVAFDAFWQDLTAAGADLVLSGHDHSYERFAPMNAFGKRSASGMREFVSGLGGRSLTGFPGTPRAASEVRSAVHPGVLDLTLRPDGYDWRETPIAGQTVPSDSGSTACR
jgi:hypothetical protein